MRYPFIVLSWNFLIGVIDEESYLDAGLFPALNLIDFRKDEFPELLLVSLCEDLDLVVDYGLVEQTGHEDDEIKLSRCLAEEFTVPPFYELYQLPQ